MKIKVELYIFKCNIIKIFKNVLMIFKSMFKNQS